jgi:hypothetical protein
VWPFELYCLRHGSWMERGSCYECPYDTSVRYFFLLKGTIIQHCRPQP